MKNTKLNLGQPALIGLASLFILSLSVASVRPRKRERVIRRRKSTARGPHNPVHPRSHQ